MIVIEQLSARHDRSAFDCGVQELNTYIQKYSGQHQRKGMGRTYVAIEDGKTHVVGYYTISSSAVAFDSVPDNLPRHPVPVVLIGRLAVDTSVRGAGLGETLLMHALQSATRASEILGVYAVVVDALDQNAKSFYVRYGFKELIDDQLHLYLTMKAVSRLQL